MDLQVLAPVLGLNKVRGGHSAVLLRNARAKYCAGADQRFFHFYLPSGANGVPLNWILSDGVANRVWRSTEDEPSGNARELACMRAWFRQWTTGPAGSGGCYQCTCRD
jgi:hypothetical protein